MMDDFSQAGSTSKGSNEWVSKIKEQRIHVSFDNAVFQHPEVKKMRYQKGLLFKYLIKIAITCACFSWFLLEDSESIHTV